MGARIDDLAIDTLRFLSVDMVQQANSGHPGMPMGAAATAYTLWTRFLHFDPTDPTWADRDRFVLSGGHGCALLYALLHLTGYDLSLDDLKAFRQWGSRTPGHPEYGHTPGVEATTGPLGQGIANAVGMAIAEASLAARFNRPGHAIVDHYTYAMCGDGDLMEGVSAEAASLAGHLALGKLVVLYDDNHISIEGGTDLAFTEDVCGRFSAYGWHVQRVDDGNDIAAIAAAIEAARAEKSRPSFIAVRTHIGFGSPHKQDTAGAHGEPLGVDEVRLTKDALGWPTEPAFHVPAEALVHFREAVPRGQARHAAWNQAFDAYRDAFRAEAAEFERRMAGQLPDGWDAELPVFESGAAATRETGGIVLNAIAARVPELMGGSADLAPSTKTLVDGAGDFQVGRYDGRNLRFGVREHAMGAVVNGMAYHGGFVPYGSTFLVFSDYMRPPIRLAALGKLHVIHVFTHDSVGLGEDGPTHQPVEHLAALRAIPGAIVMRPADANETVAAWRFAMTSRRHPVLLALSRQKLPVLSPVAYPQLKEGVMRGGYVLAGADGTPDAIAVASGSEVHLALEAREALAAAGVDVRVVSMPSTELFAGQAEEYRAAVMVPGVPVVSAEAGITLGWRTYLGEGTTAVGIDRFGASAPGDTVLRELGITAEHIVAAIRDAIG
ncbi:MAG: transketolase [Actinobacteria bacterium]|nr:MAG: transketolase [Actinomycetota bacterium]